MRKPAEIANSVRKALARLIASGEAERAVLQLGKWVSLVLAVSAMLVVVLVWFFWHIKKSGGPCHHPSGMLDRIKGGARQYFVTDHWDQNGNLLPKGFPEGIKKTPATLPCGNTVLVPTMTWDRNGWGPIHFAYTEPTYCTHEFQGHGTGKESRYFARVQCQPDCGGKILSLEAKGSIDAEGSVKVEEKYDCERTSTIAMRRLRRWIRRLWW